jgi:hypothetical protein
VDKHQGKALTLLWSIRQAAIPPNHPMTAGDFIRLRTYAQPGQWKTGMIATTRAIPASRTDPSLWIKRLNRFYPHDSAPYYYQQFLSLILDLVERRQAALRA